MKKFNVGADPELFIIDTTTNKVVSSVGLLPGTKDEPYVGEDMPEGFGLQTDNILGEFNIPPCYTDNEFIDNINYMKDYIRKYVKNINPNYDIKCAASMIVDDDQLQTDQAKLFGCDVDFNAYTENKNPKPKGETTNLRSAGFHIHISYNRPTIKKSLLFIKYLDAYMTVPLLKYDTDTRRRTLYGKAGCFRLKPYGFEYRTLSGAMLENESLLELVWDGIMLAKQAFEEGGDLPDSDLVLAAINDLDKEAEEEIISFINEYKES